MKKIKDAFLRLSAIVLPEWMAPVFIFSGLFLFFWTFVIEAGPFSGRLASHLSRLLVWHPGAAAFFY